MVSQSQADSWQSDLLPALSSLPWDDKNRKSHLNMAGLKLFCCARGHQCHLLNIDSLITVQTQGPTWLCLDRTDTNSSSPDTWEVLDYATFSDWCYRAWDLTKSMLWCSQSDLTTNSELSWIMSLWVMCLYMEERRGCRSPLHWDWGLILDSVITASDTKHASQSKLLCMGCSVIAWL